MILILFAWLLATLAISALFIAALGVLRLPDALSRQHAATKAATFAVTLFALALLLFTLASGWDWGWIGRLLSIIVLLFVTLPLASHALARASLAEEQTS